VIHVNRMNSYKQVVETISLDREKLISKANRVPVAFLKLIDKAIEKEGSVVIEVAHLSTLEKRCSDLITKNWDVTGFIAAIKLYRSEARVTLKYAKLYCEELRSKLKRG